MFQTFLTHKFEISKIEDCDLFEFCFLSFEILTSLLNSKHGTLNLSADRQARNSKL
jgi:hypothetical protein